MAGWRRSGIRTSLHTISLITGNFTGNSEESGAHGDLFLQETLVPQRSFSQFPTQNNRENICENREFSRASRENHVKKQGPLRLVSFATLKTVIASPPPASRRSTEGWTKLPLDRLISSQRFAVASERGDTNRTAVVLTSRDLNRFS